MPYFALVFLVVGLTAVIAGALGMYGLATIASLIACVLLVVGMVLLIIHLASARSRPVV